MPDYVANSFFFQGRTGAYLIILFPYHSVGSRVDKSKLCLDDHLQKIMHIKLSLFVSLLPKWSFPPKQTHRHRNALIYSTKICLTQKMPDLEKLAPKEFF